MRRAGGSHRPVAVRSTPGTLCAMAAAAALLASAPARALECPEARADAALARIPVEDRIAFLSTRLEAERAPAERWSHIWVLVDGTLAVTQLAAIPAASSTAGRGLLGFGAATSSIGALQALLLPAVPSKQPRGSRCAELVYLEKTLERGARNQALGTGVLAHIGNFAVNAAFGVGVGFVERRWAAGLATFGVGFALGEAQILTQPTGLIRDAQRYREGNLDLRPRVPLASAPAVGVFRVRGGAGISITVGL